MFFYSDSKDDILNQISDTAACCSNDLNAQKNKLNILIKILQELNSAIQKTDYFEETDSITDLLKSLKTSIEDLRSNITNMENFIHSLNTVYYGYKDSPNSINISAVIKEFNHNLLNSRNDMQKSDTEFYNLILQYTRHTNVNIATYSNHSQSFGVNSAIPYSINTIDDEITDNRTLLISEKKRKVFLPYYVSDLNEQLRKNKSYQNYKDVINNKYVVSLDKYRNPFISRFKEAYNLMKKKERASIGDSLDLALGVTFNSSLNPAVISACRNLEELDTYLDCLELNELDKFKCFEIKYEFLPYKK